MPMSFRQGIASKLPDVGTTIFTVMSRRAAEQGAVNVGQGFPDYPIDPRPGRLRRRRGRGRFQPVRAHGRQRARCAPPSPPRSPPPAGAPSIPETELTVSCGGTESIYSAIQAVVGAGRRGHRLRSVLRRLRSRRSAWRAAAASTFRSRRRISATTGSACAPPQRAHAAHHHQQSAQPGLHRGDGRRPRRAGRR